MSLKPDTHHSETALPQQLIELPMYLMLTLVKQGYRHAVRSDHKFRMPDYAVLSVLSEFGASDQRAIGERLQFDKSDVTKIINHLESEGLVERGEHKEDKRRHQVALTSKGKKQVESIRQEIVNSMRSFLKGLSASEYEQLSKLLRKSLNAYDPRF
jgi:DNA-binding MarR family transcriptional regulator